MPDWTIRSATAQDLGSLLCLWETVGTPPGVSDTHEGLLRLLAVDPHGLLLAESGGSVIGSLIASWDGWRASFYRLAVHPDWRRRGIATALLRDGEHHLEALGALRLTAIVADDDPGALDFWRASGYRRQQHRVRYVRHLKDTSLGERNKPIRTTQNPKK